MGSKQIESSSSWGDTTSPEGKGRRVYVTNFPMRALPKNFYEFFGSVDMMEGFRLRGRNAFIQFKRPQHFSLALSKNGEPFLGQSLIIDRYKAKMKKAPPPNMQSAPEHRSRARIRRGSQSRSRSRSRSLGSNDFTRSKREARLNRESPEDNKLESTAAATLEDSTDSDKVPVDFWGRPIEIYPRVTNQQLPTPVQVPDIVGELPREISLTMELIMMQKTAKTLSLIQVQNLINYFESVKVEIQHNNSTAANQNGHSSNNGAVASTNNNSQQFQETRDNQQPEQTRSLEPVSSKFYTQMATSNNQGSRQNDEEPRDDAELKDDDEPKDDDESQRLDPEKFKFVAEMLRDAFAPEPHKYTTN